MAKCRKCRDKKQIQAALDRVPERKTGSIRKAKRDEMRRIKKQKMRQQQAQ